MKNLPELLRKNEDWLMEQVLGYSRRQGYTKYTSTLKEAWRISIQGLTDAISSAVETGRDLELTPDEDYTGDPVTQFGIIEAKKHRERGISLSMFLGLFKYYRESYYDLIKDQDYPKDERDRTLVFLSRAFDRIETGFSSEWSQLGDEARLQELMETNRYMTNEKNMYLTVAESIASTVFVTDTAGRVTYINTAASKMLGLSPVPGGYYYNRENIDVHLPDWINLQVEWFTTNAMTEKFFESVSGDRYYHGRIASMADVSGKYSGAVIILNDVTELKFAEQQIRIQRDELEQVLHELKVLHGILPICANCKKIRNDKGGWDHVEVYMRDHTDAEFSHGLCPECAEKLYPGMNLKRHK
ncbi:MAG TPA: PAS domain-containing protein [Spirochaetota bacterium]|nr:PAS domain-containing protein [Spirochaetota bacterium]